MADYTYQINSNLRSISKNLDDLYKNLRIVNDNIDTVSRRVTNVDDNVRVVYSEVYELAQQFHDYVSKQMRENALVKANQRIIQIRQEMEKKFGHYDKVRRNTIGILQADDLGIVKKDTITNASEELMLSTPGYWLSPCLIALAAWINDKQELAERSLKEAIKRNDEKTSLFFALVCRRADRKSAALKWTQRYLANQDAEDLDRKTIIILDAFASGLLGADSEGVISKQMGEWLEHLTNKPGFIEAQTKQWSDAIMLKKRPYYGDDYKYLSKYSKTWPQLCDVMAGAELHASLLEYFTDIFEQEVSTDSLKAQLDDILESLVTDFDEVETPLRKEEKLNQLILDLEGDEEMAKQHMQIEETAFGEHKDFTQLLTDAAMKPESANASASTQKFAIALSKEWISNAYNDIVAQNRMNIPNNIEINIDNFCDITTDGNNEGEVIARFEQQVEEERKMMLSKMQLSGFEKFCLWGGTSIGIIGLIMMASGSMALGLISLIAGGGMFINYISKQGKAEQKHKKLNEQFEEKRANGTLIIKALMAEVVDIRAEFEKKDSESQKVSDFLDQISPEQYVKKLADSNRRVKII